MAKSRPKHVECSFLIPERGDRQFSDGSPHATEKWDWLDDRLDDMFGAATKAPGLYSGFYRDPDTGERVWDDSHRFLVAIPRSRLRGLRELLREACRVFDQKCIYLSVAGQVELIERPRS